MIVRNANKPAAELLTEQHRLLLKAALLDKPAALSAFETWHKNADWAGNFDVATLQLLPQLYINLTRHGCDDPIMSRLRGLYRRTWYRNQKLSSVLHKLIGQLQTADVSTMLLGDAALMYGYCSGFAVRDLSSLDILIPYECLAAARRILEFGKWQADTSTIIQYDEHIGFTHALGHTCNLFWSIPPKSGRGQATSWKRARSIEFNGIRTLVPDAAELLLYNISNELTRKDTPMLPNLAAFAIITRSPGMDWSLASRLAKDTYSDLVLYRVLTKLNDALDACVPEAILIELEQRPVSLAERLEMRMARKDPEAKDTFFGPLERLVLGFLRYIGNATTTEMLAEFPAYLRHHYGTGSIIKIAINVFVNGVRRIGRVVSRLLGRDKNRMAI